RFVWTVLRLAVPRSKARLSLKAAVRPEAWQLAQAFIRTGCACATNLLSDSVVSSIDGAVVAGAAGSFFGGGALAVVSAARCRLRSSRRLSGWLGRSSTAA